MTAQCTSKAGSEESLSDESLFVEMIERSQRNIGQFTLGVALALLGHIGLYLLVLAKTRGDLDSMATFFIWFFGIIQFVYTVPLFIGALCFKKGLVGLGIIITSFLTFFLWMVLFASLGA